MKQVDILAEQKRMTEEPVSRLVLRLALPTTISQLITVLYNTADTYFVSQIGTGAAGAVGVVFAVMGMIQAVGFGMGMGTGSIISRSLGAKENERAEKFAASGFLIAALLGLILMTSGLIALRPLMELLGATQTILPYCEEYAKYILLGAPVMCASFVLSCILRSEGEAKFAMVGLTAGGLLNVALDPLLIYTLNMGIAGAAVATVISQCISFIVLIIFFMLKKSVVPLNLKKISTKPKDYFMIVKIGFPTICRQSLSSVASALLTIEAKPFGDAAIAAVTIANKIYMLVRNIVIGIGQGLQPVAGYNYGAKRIDRVREGFYFAVKLGTAVCVALAAVIALNAGAIAGIFRSDDSKVIEIASHTLYFACAAIPFMAYSTYVNQLQQCLGFGLSATLLACSRQGFCFIPLAIILPMLFSLTGVEAIASVSDILTFIITVPCQIYFFKKHLKIEEKKSSQKC